MMPALLQFLLPLIGWEAASRLASGVGRRLLGKSAQEAAEGAAGWMGKSMVGRGINRALAPAAQALPAKVAPYANAEGMTRGLVRGGAMLGSLAAGGVGAMTLTELLNGPEGVSHALDVAGLPDQERVRQDAAIGSMVDQAQLEEALAQYVGDRQMAAALMQQQGLV